MGDAMSIERVLLEGLHADDPVAAVREVELPTGYRRVWQGAVCPGDLYLHRTLLLYDDVVRWVPIDDPEKETYDQADAFTCLIRRGAFVDDGCEKCKVLIRAKRSRFCWHCTDLIVTAIREENRA